MLSNLCSVLMMVPHDRLGWHFEHITIFRKLKLFSSSRGKVGEGHSSGKLSHFQLKVKRETQSSICCSATNLIRCTLSTTPDHIYSKCCPILWPVDDTLGKQFSILPSVFLCLFLVTLFCCIPLPLSYMPKFDKCYFRPKSHQSI
jgi:hypothetical protein